MAPPWVNSGLLLLIIVAVCLTSFVATSINVDELNAISYHVDILNSPVLGGQESPGSGSVIQITSRYGQEYQCSLPAAASSFYGDESVRGGDGDPSSDPADLGQLLKPLETSPCLTKTKDWWTYEFCYGKHIKQYHLEDNKIASPIIVLGLYESEYDWNNESKADENSRNRLQRYHSQYYVNGSTCDITGTQRRSEVRFVCEDGSGDYIHHVDEPESCRYIVTIHTTKVCHHPYLRLPPNNEAQSIVCNPVLTSDQYEKYLIIEQEKKAAVEEKRKVWLAKQEEQLIALKKSREDQARERKEIDDVVVDEVSSSEEEEEDEELENEQEDQQDESNSILDEGEDKVQETSRKQMSPFGQSNKADPKSPSLERVSDDEENRKATQLGDHQESLATAKTMFTDVEELDRLSEKWRSLRDDIEGKMKEVDDQMKQHTDKDGEGHERENGVEHDILERLSSILKHLLQHVDKAELDTKRASSGLVNLQDYIDSVSTDDDNYDEVVTQKTEMEMEPGPEDKEEEDFSAETASPPKPVIKYKKFSEILKALKAKGKEISKEELDKDNTMGDIEKVLVQKLKDSGIDTRGRKFEVKILTANYFDDDGEELEGRHNEDDSGEYQTVLIKLMGDDDEATEHMQHQDMMEKNYRFVWNGANSADTNDEKKKKEAQLDWNKG